MRQLAVAVDDIHSFNNSIQFVLQTKTNWPSLSITRQAYTNCQPLSKLTKLMTTKNSKQITESFCKFLFIHNNVETTLFSQQHLCICICQLHLSTLRRASHKICLTHVVYVRLDPRQKKNAKNGQQSAITKFYSSAKWSCLLLIVDHLEQEIKRNNFNKPLVDHCLNRELKKILNKICWTSFFEKRKRFVESYYESRSFWSEPK